MMGRLEPAEMCPSILHLNRRKGVNKGAAHNAWKSPGPDRACLAGGQAGSYNTSKSGGGNRKSRRPWANCQISFADVRYEVQFWISISSTQERARQTFDNSSAARVCPNDCLWSITSFRCYAATASLWERSRHHFGASRHPHEILGTGYQLSPLPRLFLVWLN
jgi:hypothetical protein